MTVFVDINYNNIFNTRSSGALLVDHPTQLICIWIFICWVGGGDPCGAVDFCISGPCGQKKQAGSNVFEKYPCHVHIVREEAKNTPKKVFLSALLTISATFGANNFWVQQLLAPTTFESSNFWGQQLLPPHKSHKMQHQDWRIFVIFHSSGKCFRLLYILCNCSARNGGENRVPIWKAHLSLPAESSRSSRWVVADGEGRLLCDYSLRTWFNPPAVCAPNQQCAGSWCPNCFPEWTASVTAHWQVRNAL